MKDDKPEASTAEFSPSHGGAEDPGSSKTRWSRVIKAGHGSLEDLEWLCRTYWGPLYGLLRYQGYGKEEAEDLVQGFFASFLKRDWSRTLSPENGRFRDFLFKSLANYSKNEWEKASALKRGAGKAPIPIDTHAWEDSHGLEPEQASSDAEYYDRAWAVELVNRSLKELELRCSTLDKRQLFEEISRLVQGEQVSMSAAGSGDNATRQARSRLRKSFQEILREEVRATLTEECDLDEELKHLIKVLTGVVQ